MADEQDRLGRLADALLEPDLAGHVEVVVGLVEQQHLVGAAQEVLQHQPLLLTAGERRERAVPRPVVGQPHRGDGARVPGDLEVVAAGVGVVRQRLGVAHLRRLVVGLHQRQLARVDGARGRPHARRGDAEEQVGDRLVDPPVADELAHDAQPAGAGDRAGVRDEVAGHDPQQGRLAGAVGADQRDLGAVADPEADLVEKYSSVGQLVAHSRHIHMSHAGHCP